MEDQLAIRKLGGRFAGGAPLGLLQQNVLPKRVGTLQSVSSQAISAGQKARVQPPCSIFGSQQDEQVRVTHWNGVRVGDSLSRQPLHAGLKVTCALPEPIQQLLQVRFNMAAHVC